MQTSRVMQLKTNSFARWLGVICLVAITLRLIWLGLSAHVPISAADVSDQANYLDLAQKFSLGEGYNELYYAPLYPLLLGVVFTLQRWSGLTGVPIRAFMGAFQIALSVSVIIMTAKLGARRLTPRIGLVAAALLAVWPNYIASVGTLMTEQLSTPLFVGGMLALLWDRHPTRQQVILSGSLFGLSVLARPALGFILLAGLIVLYVDRRSWQNWLRRGAWFLSAALIVILPWLAYTYAQTGTPTIGIAGGFNLCLGNNDLGLTSWDQRSIDSFCPMPKNPADDKELYAQTIDWMIHHPQHQPRLIAARTFNMFFVDFSASGLYPTNNSWQVRLVPRPLFYAVSFGWWLCMLVWSITGFVRLKDRRLKSCFLILALGTILIPLLSVGQDRYHDAVIPIMALMAAYSCCRPSTRRAALIERLARTKLAARISA